jgi:hypothetical protein
VAVQLTGGLGNNLFVAAFGVGLALRRAGTATGVALLRTDIIDLRGQETRKYERTIFARFRAFDDSGEWRRTLIDEGEKAAAAGAAEAAEAVAAAHAATATAAAARSPPQEIGLLDWRNWCREFDAARMEQWAAAPCGALQVATGYFQDAGFFRNESALVRRLFAVPEALAREFRTRYPPPALGGGGGGGGGAAALNTSAGPPGGVPWAVHVRRGDYVEKAEWHHLLPMSYFAEGVARMLEHLAASGAAGGPIFVFSDDVAWVRAQEPFRSLEGAVFVDERDPLRAFYMLALAAEGGVLCSNSTFCWWAAFLSELGRRRAVRRLVIFPDGWTATHSLTGFHGPGDCGGALRMPYMTVLDGFR